MISKFLFPIRLVAWAGGGRASQTPTHGGPGDSLLSLTPSINSLSLSLSQERVAAAAIGGGDFPGSPHRQAFSWPGSQDGREALERWRCRACESWSASPPPLPDTRG